MIFWFFTICIDALACAGFDYTKIKAVYPTKAQQLLFIQAYLEETDRRGGGGNQKSKISKRKKNEHNIVLFLIIVRPYGYMHTPHYSSSNVFTCACLDNGTSETGAEKLYTEVQCMT